MLELYDLVSLTDMSPDTHFACVQGHAAPILYAAWAEAGFVKESDLLNLRKIDCDLEGHPTPVSPEFLPPSSLSLNFSWESKGM